MKRFALIAILCLGLLGAGTSVTAQVVAQGEEELNLDDIMVSLELIDVELSTFLQDLFEEYDIEYIFPTDLDLNGEGRGDQSPRAISARFENVPLSEVLEATLGIFGLQFEIIAERVIVIAPVERITEWHEARAVGFEVEMREEQARIRDAQRAALRELQEAREQARQAIEERRRALHEAGVEPAGLEGAILQLDLIDRDIESARAAAAMERELSDPQPRPEPIITHVFPLEHRDPMEVAPSLDLLIGANEGIAYDRQHLIVRARQETLDNIGHVLQEIDTPDPQE
jgi:hypothetical protein